MATRSVGYGKTYATPALADAAASTSDRIEYYSATSDGSAGASYENTPAQTKGLQHVGIVPTALHFSSLDWTDNNSTLSFTNIAFNGQIGPRLLSTAAGNKMVLDRCILWTRNRCIQQQRSQTTVEVHNSVLVSFGSGGAYSQAPFYQLDGTTLISNSVLVNRAASGLGFANTGGTATLVNNKIYADAGCYAGGTIVDDYNEGSTTGLTGANNTARSVSEMGFDFTLTNFCEGRVDSAYELAGTTSFNGYTLTSKYTTDIDGNARPATAAGYARGCSYGFKVYATPDYPDRENVLTTDTVNGLAGLFTEPGVANVLTGVQYGANGTELTGTFDESARNTDPGEANVLDGTGYLIQNVSKTGSFDEAARNTDPGEANVKTAITYKIQNVDKVGTYAGGGTPPAIPTITWTDSQDGTGGIIAISGSDGGTTNTVYYKAYGATSWTSGGSRSGDGNVAISITAQGVYWFYVTSVLAGTSASTPISGAVTNSDQSNIERIMDSVAAVINDAALTDSEGDTITATVEIPPNFDSVNTSVVKVFPDGDDTTPDRTKLNLVQYRVNVALCERARTEAVQEGDMLVREKLQDLFCGKRLDGFTIMHCTGTSSPSAVDLEQLWEQFQWISVITFEFEALRVRL